ncbi:Rieske 2Fe-2S domain-containing protein [Pontibacter sp. G13]|uniref:Rieske (2Fe-2S) protein n=1 Tax=Pontibacter sp. G13 TaxID=3074898 RepID=UPI00288A7BCC|nr:Rieske 2Fe-2S domain-containing protein [Pontibacter sp. G13]WNJ21212.1 Rieske 2Fe-2S domain-containing protein [Pontibacter sp. G13]
MNAQEWFVVEPEAWIPGKDLEGGYLKEIKIEGKRICIARHKGEWHAFDARCPHAGGAFVGGKISDKDEVLCPWHQFAFRLKDGTCDSGGYFVEIYELKATKLALKIRIPRKRRSWWPF